MNYQRSNWRENYSSGCSCEGRSRNNTQPWTRRNWDACGCDNNSASSGFACGNNSARSGYGCGNNSARSGFVCGNNSARSGCGCGNNNARSGFACGNNSARSGCGCGNNNARSGFACGNNSARSGCDCGNNNARSGCGCGNNNARSGCGYDVDTADILQKNRSCPCPNQGTEWRNRSGCACGEARTTCTGTPCNKGAEDQGFLTGQSLAMVYSPYQHFQELYDPREGLCSGTIFTELNKPFCPKSGC